MSCPALPCELDLVRELAAELGAPPERAAGVRRVGLDLQGVHLSALRWGSEATQVLLHGGAQNAHTWDRMMLHARHDGVAVDLPGHGRSAWMGSRSYLPRELAPILAEGIERWAPAADVVIGMSLGGLSALHLAVIRPDLVRRLVLVDVTPGSTPERSQDLRDFVDVDDFESFEAMVEHAARHGIGGGGRSLRRSLWHNARQRPDGRWTWRHDRRDPPGEERMARLFADLPSYWDDVAALACPVLLVTGGRSPIVTSADVERFVALAPTAEVVEIAESGHSVQSDAPEQLADLIAAFATSSRSS